MTVTLPGNNLLNAGILPIVAQEIEHRYLVQSEEWKRLAPKGELYRQGYLSLDEDRSVRVRASNGVAFITVKGKRAGLARAEFEYPIPMRDAEQILNQLCEKPIIIKTRYKLRQNKQLWEIDEYGEENRGLVIAEAETKPGSNLPRTPPWLGSEISGDGRFDNIHLVEEPFAKWPENGGPPDTKFHLKSSESVPEGMSRAAHEQLNLAIHELLQGRGDVDESIHEARKALKKTRSLLRLARSELGAIYDQANSRLRDLGRTLSRVRDAAALIEMVNAVGADDELKASAKKPVQQLLKLLIRRHAEIRRDFESSGERPRVADALREIVDGSAAWPVDQVNFPVVLAGVTNTVRRGRKAMERAISHHQPADFHEWRKRAKDLRYQMTFLHKLWPEVLQGYADSAEELEQALGEEHNFTVLSDLIEELPLPKRSAAEIHSLIDERRAKLRRQALQTGHLLYDERPNRWGRRLAQCWQYR